MDRYDEDLHCNQFFIGFQKNHDLFDHVTSQRFMVVIIIIIIITIIIIDNSVYRRLFAQRILIYFQSCSS